MHVLRHIFKYDVVAEVKKGIAHVCREGKGEESGIRREFRKEDREWVYCVKSEGGSVPRWGTISSWRGDREGGNAGIYARCGRE